MLSQYCSGKFYNCHWCNKKYKTPDKFEKHVNSEHPFVTIGKNSHKLSLEDKMYLLDCFEQYSQLLLNVNDIVNIDEVIEQYRNWDGVSEINNNIKFIQASHKLNPTSYKTNKISNEECIDLKRMVENHLIFQQRAIESGLLAKSLSNKDQLLRLFDEFELFLNLGRPWQGGNFCPSLIIDLIWHSAMMDNLKYIKLCDKFFRQTLTHCLLENEDKHGERYQQFEQYFANQHGTQRLKIIDLVLGNDVNIITDIRQDFQNQEAAIIQQNQEAAIRFKERMEKYRIEVEEQKRNGTYRYFDDGKC